MNEKTTTKKPRDFKLYFLIQTVYYSELFYDHKHFITLLLFILSYT